MGSKNVHAERALWSWAQQASQGLGRKRRRRVDEGAGRAPLWLACFCLHVANSISNSIVNSITNSVASFIACF
eukprot:343543-Chlamydomonas_euryale.AAC.1